MSPGQITSESHQTTKAQNQCISKFHIGISSDDIQMSSCDIRKVIVGHSESRQTTFEKSSGDIRKVASDIRKVVKRHSESRQATFRISSGDIWMSPGEQYTTFFNVVLQEFDVGDRVKVSEQFMSNSKEVTERMRNEEGAATLEEEKTEKDVKIQKNIIIKAKRKGNIRTINNTGDMQIKFDKLNSAQWVTSRNFSKLYVIHAVFLRFLSFGKSQNVLHGRMADQDGRFRLCQFECRMAQLARRLRSCVGGWVWEGCRLVRILPPSGPASRFGSWCALFSSTASRTRWNVLDFGGCF